MVAGDLEWRPVGRWRAAIESASRAGRRIGYRWRQRPSRSGAAPSRETPMKANQLILIVACVCFAIAVLTTAGIVKVEKVDWTDLGLFFGFLAFLIK
jgi:hypothetical protein